MREAGPVGRVLRSPKNGYTRMLLRCDPARITEKTPAPAHARAEGRDTPGITAFAGPPDRIRRSKPPLLSVEGLRVTFRRTSLLRGLFGARGDFVVQAVKGVSFTVERGETVAIVGESGSGKTTPRAQHRGAAEARMRLHRNRRGGPRAPHGPRSHRASPEGGDDVSGSRRFPESALQGGADRDGADGDPRPPDVGPEAGGVPASRPRGSGPGLRRALSPRVERRRGSPGRGGARALRFAGSGGGRRAHRRPRSLDPGGTAQPAGRDPGTHGARHPPHHPQSGGGPSLERSDHRHVPGGVPGAGSDGGRLRRAPARLYPAAALRERAPAAGDGAPGGERGRGGRAHESEGYGGRRPWWGFAAGEFPLRAGWGALEGGARGEAEAPSGSLRGDGSLPPARIRDAGRRRGARPRRRGRGGR